MDNKENFTLLYSIYISALMAGWVTLTLIYFDWKLVLILFLCQWWSNQARKFIKRIK